MTRILICLCINDICFLFRQACKEEQSVNHLLTDDKKNDQSCWHRYQLMSKLYKLALFSLQKQDLYSYYLQYISLLILISLYPYQFVWARPDFKHNLHEKSNIYHNICNIDHHLKLLLILRCAHGIIIAERSKVQIKVLWKHDLYYLIIMFMLQWYDNSNRPTIGKEWCTTGNKLIIVIDSDGGGNVDIRLKVFIKGMIYTIFVMFQSIFKAA